VTAPRGRRDHLPALRAHQRRARHQPHGTPVCVDGDRCRVVDVLDGVLDVSEDVVGSDRERLSIHHRGARGCQRDHAPGHVRVQRRYDQRCAPLPRELDDVLRRRCAIREHQQRGAQLERFALRVVAVPDHDDIARLDPARRPGLPAEHPDPARHEMVLAHQCLALEDIHDRADGRRRVHEARRLARLADVPSRERALGHHTDDRAIVIHHRHHVGLRPGHLQPGTAHRFVVAADRELRLHHVAGAQQDVRQEARFRRAASLQRPARLRIHLTEPDGHVLASLL
jgi:hypothetical protein